MSDKVKFALRDLGVAVAAAVLGILLPDVASHGVFGTHLPDLKAALDSGATAALLWATAWITPLTRKYGVGSDPLSYRSAGLEATVSTSPLPVDSSPPII